MQNGSTKSFLLQARKEKKAFFDQKKKKKNGSKNHRNLHFLKGVSPWYLSKNGDFLILRFMQNGSRNGVF